MQMLCCSSCEHSIVSSGTTSAYEVVCTEHILGDLSGCQLVWVWPTEDAACRFGREAYVLQPQQTKPEVACYKAHKHCHDGQTRLLEWGLVCTAAMRMCLLFLHSRCKTVPIQHTFVNRFHSGHSAKARQGQYMDKHNTQLAEPQTCC